MSPIAATDTHRTQIAEMVDEAVEELSTRLDFDDNWDADERAEFADLRDRLTGLNVDGADLDTGLLTSAYLMARAYNRTIPADAGDAQRMDVRVVALDRLAGDLGLG